MNNIVDYKLNLGVIVLYENLVALQGIFDGSLPSGVEKELDKLIDILIKELNCENPKFRDYDMKDVEYFKRVYYEDEPSPYAKK